MFSFLWKVSLILYLSTVIGHIHHFSSPSKSNAIDHFRITFGLFFKASLGAHPFIWKLVLIHMQMKTNFHMKRWAPRLALKKRPKVIRKRPIVTSLGAFFRALRFLIGRTILTCPIKVRYSLLFLISPVPHLVQASAFLWTSVPVPRVVSWEVQERFSFLAGRRNK